MRSKDMQRAAFQERAKAVVAAAGGEDSQALETALMNFAEGIQNDVLEEAKQFQGIQDATILAARGIRQLTADESTYWQKVIGAMKSASPKKALTDLDVVMPETIIDNVFEDLQQAHPLLNVISFQFGRGITTWLLNTNPEQMATWDALCAEIVKQLTSGFRAMTVSQNKLSAFLPVCNSMLDLGPLWLDRYVRAVLMEALALGLEDGIINGRGQTTSIFEPIGMRKDIGADVVVNQSTGYPDKDAIAVTSLDPVTYGTILAGLSKTEKGNPRTVTNVILIVNPTDYLMKVMPATVFMTPQGTYARDVLPFPTQIIQSVCLEEGEAIIGLADRYFFIGGIGKDGRLEFSDEYQFLEDNRVYRIKLLGHGQALDNNAFQLLDISGLEPLIQQVKVVNLSDVPVAEIPAG